MRLATQKAGSFMSGGEAAVAQNSIKGWRFGVIKWEEERPRGLQRCRDEGDSCAKIKACCFRSRSWLCLDKISFLR